MARLSGRWRPAGSEVAEDSLRELRVTAIPGHILWKYADTASHLLNPVFPGCVFE